LRLSTWNIHKGDRDLGAIQQRELSERMSSKPVLFVYHLLRCQLTN
jgi:hypothetical protein